LWTCSPPPNPERNSSPEIITIIDHLASSHHIASMDDSLSALPPETASWKKHNRPRYASQASTSTRAESPMTNLQQQAAGLGMSVNVHHAA